jgi:hypothetical protein
MAANASRHRMLGVGLRFGIGLVAAFLAGGAVAEHVWRHELQYANR